MDFGLHNSAMAFGLYITDWGDVGSGTLSIGTDNGDLFTVATGPQPGDQDIFFGISSTIPFNQVTIYQNNDNDGYSVDEVYYGVPEPSAFAIFILGAIMAKRRCEKSGTDIM